MDSSSLRDCLYRTQAGRSSSRARQLAWVVSELESFAAALSPSEQLPGSPGWFDPSFVAAYLSEADNGRLRTRGAQARPSPDATRRVRRACLRLLAAQAGVADPVKDSVALPDLHPKADERLAARAVRHWEWRALPVDASPADVRTAAMAVLVHEVGMRSGELAALLPADLDLRAGTVTYQPRPPSTRTLPPPRTVSLSDTAVAALRHWLKVREILTVNTPRTRTLWVSLAANHNGSGVRRPAGMPLQPTGLRRAHARAVASLNVHLAGTPGFEALPRTVGRLRRDKPEKNAATEKAPDLQDR